MKILYQDNGWLDLEIRKCKLDGRFKYSYYHSSNLIAMSKEYPGFERYFEDEKADCFARDKYCDPGEPILFSI